MAKKFDLQAASDLFKTKYGKLSEVSYNNANALMSRTKKEHNFTGKKLELPVPTKFQGGVGSGALPKSNSATAETVSLTRKKIYARAKIDREAIKAAQNDEGAFIRQTKYTVEQTVDSYNRNMSRMLFHDGTGSLGVVDTVDASTASEHLVTITVASWKEANFEEQDYVNIDSGTDLLEITEVLPATRQVRVELVTGSLPALVGSETIYMQGSKDNDCSGLKTLSEAASGSTVYGVTVGRRWEMHSIDAASAGISASLLNQIMIKVQQKSGKVPNLLVTSFTQYRKILDFLESDKRYPIEPRDKSLQGKISFSGVEFMSAAGPVPIIPERFCDDDRVYALNDKYICIHHAPDFGWHDDDGTVFLREADEDSYEARYGGYKEIYIVPPFQGVIKNLAV